MRPGLKTLLGLGSVFFGLVLATPMTRPTRGDEPVSRWGRLFRFGGGSASSSASHAAQPRDMSHELNPSAGPPVLSTSPSLTGPPPAAPRLIPQPRVNRAVTDADPVLTRIALARSNDGNPFGMFLQVFADGTVLDGEGIHHVGPNDLKPVLDALQASELYRLKGHCGAPPTDFIEQVHLVVYDRSYGRLRANAFSYSGNPQGCDNSVRQLHLTIENLQGKLTRPMPGSTPATTATVPLSSPAAPSSAIPLTPIN